MNEAIEIWREKDSYILEKDFEQNREKQGHTTGMESFIYYFDP